MNYREEINIFKLQHLANFNRKIKKNAEQRVDKRKAMVMVLFDFVVAKRVGYRKEYEPSKLKEKI